MASDIFIKIDGIKGESQDSKHKDEIDVLSWSWGANNQGTAHIGAGMGAGKVSFQDLTIVKNMDKSSPTLYEMCAKGKHIPKATLVVRKAGDEPLEFITITMQDILVTNVSTAGSNGGPGGISETVSLNFGKVEYKYVEQTEKGSGAASPEFKWDIRAHKAM